MKNQEIARLFSEMGDLLELKGDNPFKIRAYRRAALNIEGLSKPVEGLSREELREIPGIGEELAAKIEEYLQSGVVHAHEKLKGELPSGILSLLAVPGLGPKTVRQLHTDLGIATVDVGNPMLSMHSIREQHAFRCASDRHIVATVPPRTGLDHAGR